MSATTYRRMVYILGAGCSAGSPPSGPGYPLADTFEKALVAFYKHRLVRPDQHRLRECAIDTAKLLREEDGQTLDKLVKRLLDRAHDFSKGNSLTQQDRKRLDLKLDYAKIATAALFLDLEQAARDTGLTRYDNFLSELFEDSRDWLAASKTRCSVLTFNYDRLFELTFIKRFGYDSKRGYLYGKSYLNSGMNYEQGYDFHVDPDRFTFLKLHGSTGICGRETTGEMTPSIRVCLESLTTYNANAICDDRFFTAPDDPNPHMPEPLIVFPRETPFTLNKDTHLTYRTYIPFVWKEAKRVLASATEIRAIGYKFEADPNYVFELLQNASNCERLIVQNKATEAEGICQKLKDWWKPGKPPFEIEPCSKLF